MELESDAARALAREQLSLVYQPQVDLRTGAIVRDRGAAALGAPAARRRPAAAFIPIAERNGLIGPIGAWVLREACGQACAWRAGRRVMAVNVSPRQLADPAFPDLVAGSCATPASPPQRLCLEITECALIADPEARAATSWR